MNKKVIIVVVLFLLGLAGYFGYQKFMGKSDSPLSNSQTSGGMKSLKDLLSSGVAQKCSFSSDGSQGVSYISGGKVRGDFTSQVSGKTTTSHMISDGATSYIWTDGEPNGFKMTVDPNQAAEVKNDYTNTSTSGAADLNQKADYKCSGWVVDGSVFTPPTNVTFSDFSQMYAPVASSMPSSGSSGSSSTCAYCNALTGDDKSQCLAALNCN